MFLSNFKKIESVKAMYLNEIETFEGSVLLWEDKYIEINKKNEGSEIDINGLSFIFEEDYVEVCQAVICSINPDLFFAIDVVDDLDLIEIIKKIKYIFENLRENKENFFKKNKSLKALKLVIIE